MRDGSFMIFVYWCYTHKFDEGATEGRQRVRTVTAFFTLFCRWFTSFHTWFKSLLFTGFSHIIPEFKLRTHIVCVCTTYYKLATRSVSNINHFKGQMKSKWGSFLKYLCSLMFLWVFIPELCGESWNENKKSCEAKKSRCTPYIYACWAGRHLISQLMYCSIIA